jgi:hypothetical protein
MAKNQKAPPSAPPNSKLTLQQYKDGSGWYVEAEWLDGFTQHVDDFGSDSEAQDWVAHESAAWLQKHPKSK